MKLPAALVVISALACATILALHDSEPSAAAMGIIALMVALSEIGSNKNPKP
jgi:hypothetical protein